MQQRVHPTRLDSPENSHTRDTFVSVKTITVRLPDSIVAEIDAESRERGVSKAGASEDDALWPASVADACIVRMTETLAEPLVLTTDSDFGVYRRHGRKVIPYLSPE